MSSETSLTLDELYSLFKPSGVPDYFQYFDAFGSEESQEPIGQEKPDGAGDLPPFRAHTFGPRGEDRRKQRAFNKGKNFKKETHEKKEKKGVMSGVVEVNPKFASVDFASAWAKPKRKEPPKKEEEKKKVEAAWGQHAKPKTKGFAEIMAEQEKLDKPKFWPVANRENGARASDDENDQPLSEGIRSNKAKKASAWGNIKP